MYNLCMDIRNYIAAYKPYNEQEANDQKQMLKWIDTGLDLFTRENGILLRVHGYVIKVISIS